MIKPTIGRKLWYWRTAQQYAAMDQLSHDHVNAVVDVQPEDATIVAVCSASMLNLQVIDHHGVARSETSVMLLKEGDTIPPSRFATWMPFQVGQAKAQNVAASS